MLFYYKSNMYSVQKIDKIPKTASKQKQLPVENRFVVAKGEGVGEGMEWEFGISRCKLLYREWIQAII